MILQTEASVPPVLTARPSLASRCIMAFVVAKLALHAVELAITPYGIHRDEFLYFSMGRHLRLWHMDFPPLIAILGNIQRLFFGDTLMAARVFPAIEGSIIIVLAALITREFGGRSFAQSLAMLTVFMAPVFMRAASLFQPVVLDQLWWTLALFALARIVRADERTLPRSWVAFGIACGLGLLTKFSILFFAMAVLAALLITPMRRSLFTRWPWLAAGIMLVLGAPSIVGQFALGFPVLLQMKDLQATQLEHVTTMSFLTEQILLIGPVSILLALAGAAALVASRALRPFAALGWACIFAFLILMLLHGKSYYAAPIYPTLLAAGAVSLERLWTRRPSRVTSGLAWATTTCVALTGIVALPISLPILSPDDTAAYAMRIGAAPALKSNRGIADRLPQDFADMLGWGVQARALAQAYHSLSPDEQRDAVIMGGNYGEASAAEFYSVRYQLPPVVSVAGSWWFFGPGTRTGRVVIAIGISRTDLERGYADVRSAGRVLSPWSVSEERDVPLFIARKPQRTLQQVWPLLAGRN